MAFLSQSDGIREENEVSLAASQYSVAQGGQPQPSIGNVVEASYENFDRNWVCCGLSF